MKTITIRLPDVAAAMLLEVQKRNKGIQGSAAAVDPADPPGIPEDLRQVG